MAKRFDELEARVGALTNNVEEINHRVGTLKAEVVEFINEQKERIIDAVHAAKDQTAIELMRESLNDSAEVMKQLNIIIALLCVITFCCVFAFLLIFN